MAYIVLTQDIRKKALHLATEPFYLVKNFFIS